VNWLVDDGPFGLLALERDPTWRWPTATLHIVQEVAAAAENDRSGRRAELLKMKR